MTPESSVSARRQLEHLGVEVMTSTMVAGIDDRGVMHVGGWIPTRTVIWAAGVTASPLGKSLGVPLDRAGRVIVNPDLSVPGAPDVFVIGDLASILKSDAKPVPGLAPAAMQEGRHAARNVVHAIRASLRSRLVTSTGARWRRSAAAQQSRRSDGLGSAVLLHGSRGCSSTSSI
jgi:NADH dehydrogenase